MERVAAVASLALVAVALFVGIGLAADWLTPYRDVVKATTPITSRIHFGREDGQAQYVGVSHQSIRSR